MTQKELDEIEIEARKITLHYYWKDWDPDKCLKWYNRLVHRFHLIVCLTPVLVMFTVFCLAEKMWPTFGMIELVAGVVIFWEGLRLFMVWFINKGTILVMEELIENAKKAKDKEGETGENGEPNNEGGKDNCGFNGS